MASNTVVQTNILALNANRNLGLVGTVKEKSSQKLSSGYKINSAADDAAGLAISEKMRAQIRGLDNASKNTQDGISLIQTAEGGMSTVNDMVKRIRDLVELAANDTNESADEDGFADLQKYQDEIDQLTAGIDQISENTQFNKKNLLSGDYDEQVAGYTIADSVVESEQTTVDWAGVFDETGESLADLNVLQDRYDSAVTAKANLNEVIELLGAPVDSAAALTAFSTAIDALQGMIDSLADAACGAGANNGLTTGVDLTSATDVRFGDGTTAWMTTIADSTLSDAVRLAALNSLTSALDALVSNAASNAFFGIDLSCATDVLATGMNTSLEGDALDALKEPFAAAVNKIKTLAASLASSLGSDFALNALKDLYSGQLADAMDTHTTISALKEELATTQSAYDELYAASLESNTTTETIETKVPGYTVETTGGTQLWFQTGANAGQGMNVNINGVDSKRLGIGQGDGVSDIIVTGKTGEEISAYLGTIDKALSYVSTERSKLGAIQNRLEYTNDNLQVSSENLSNAESRIRDTDMATEMMKYTKANIIQQAAISMLAQANQAPQSVLSLLQ